MNQNNRCFICRKEFDGNNPPSPDGIDCRLPHTVDNIVLCCVPCNKARSNQSLELVQTLVQLKQYAKENNYLLVRTNESVIIQLQDAIVCGLSNVWHRSNVTRKTYINYLKYDKGKRKVYSIDTDNVVTHLTGIDVDDLPPVVTNSSIEDLMFTDPNYLSNPVEKEKEEILKQKQHVNRIIKPENDDSEREQIEKIYNFFSINSDKNSKPNTRIYNSKKNEYEKQCTIIMDEDPDQLVGEFDIDLDESSDNINYNSSSSSSSSSSSCSEILDYYLGKKLPLTRKDKELYPDVVSLIDLGRYNKGRKSNINRNSKLLNFITKTSYFLKYFS
jgi:predicted transcriptional regulator